MNQGQQGDNPVPTPMDLFARASTQNENPGYHNFYQNQQQQPQQQQQMPNGIQQLQPMMNMFQASNRSTHNSIPNQMNNMNLHQLNQLALGQMMNNPNQFMGQNQTTNQINMMNMMNIMQQMQMGDSRNLTMNFPNEMQNHGPLNGSSVPNSLESTISSMIPGSIGQQHQSMHQNGSQQHNLDHNQSIGSSTFSNDSTPLPNPGGLNLAHQNLSLFRNMINANNRGNVSSNPNIGVGNQQNFGGQYAQSPQGFTNQSGLDISTEKLKKAAKSKKGTKADAKLKGNTDLHDTHQVNFKIEDDSIPTRGKPSRKKASSRPEDVPVESNKPNIPNLAPINGIPFGMYSNPSHLMNQRFQQRPNNFQSPSNLNFGAPTHQPQRPLPQLPTAANQRNFPGPVPTQVRPQQINLERVPSETSMHPDAIRYDDSVVKRDRVARYRNADLNYQDLIVQQAAFNKELAFERLSRVPQPPPQVTPKPPLVYNKPGPKPKGRYANRAQQQTQAEAGPKIHYGDDLGPIFYRHVDRLAKRLRETATNEEILVPIRIDLELGGIKFSDTFTWNLNDDFVSIDLFSESLCHDFQLPKHLFHDPIMQSIKGQLTDYQHHGKIAEDKLVLRSKLDSEKAPDTPLPKVSEMRILIKLDITIGRINLVDQFEWDIMCLDNSPELFANTLATDLGLGGEFVTAIAHDIREQIYAFKKSLVLLDYNFLDGGAVNDPSLHSSFLGPVTNPVRERSAADQFTPTLVELNESEILRQVKLQDRSTRRTRRQNRGTRRGASTLLPDREPIKTYRSLNLMRRTFGNSGFPFGDFDSIGNPPSSNMRKYTDDYTELEN